MRTMVEQGLLLALGLALAVLFAADGSSGHAAADGVMDAGTVAGLLAALSMAGLSDWLWRGPWAWVPTTLYVLLAVACPFWIVFLPSVAYAAARLPAPGLPSSARHPSRRPPEGAGETDLWTALRSLAGRWLWVAPLITSLPFREGFDGIPTITALPDASGVIVAAGVTSLGFALGCRAARERDGRHRLRVEQDRAREAARSSRMRLADMDEERAQSVRMATLGERTRIAREIHDNVGHLLTRAIMQVQAGKAVADAMDDDVASQGFAGLAGTLDEAMTMVRRSVHDLEDDGTDFAAQVEAAVRSLDGARLGFHVRFVNDITKAPAPVSRCFATVIRESLANVTHHSEAHGADVILRDFPAFWQLTVQDTGPAKPVPESGGGPSRGMGIADIESRVRSVGGVVACGPYRGGWRVFASVPKRQWAGANESAGKASTVASTMESTMESRKS